MRRRYKKPKKHTPYFNRNERIRARTLRVISSNGEFIGILSKYDALKKAKEENLDLVEIAPNADPPVAKIIDYNKFLYEQNKKRRQGKKPKSGEVKEIWLTPFMAEHDLKTRADRGSELLNESGKIKITVKFKRSQLRRKEYGYKIIDEVIQRMENAQLEKKPQFQGNRLVATVSKK